MGNHLRCFSAPGLRPVLRLFTHGEVVLLVASCSTGATATTPPTVTEVSISPGSVQLTGLGSETQLQASLAPSGAQGTIVWHVANPAIASVTGAGASATIHAVAGGTTQVIAAVGSVEGSAAVSVTPIARQVTLSPPAPAVRVGESTTLTATLQADAGASTALTWTTSAPSIATVSSAGLVTGIAVGTATITVTSVATPVVTASVTLTVSSGTVRSVTLTPAAATLAPTGTRQLTATFDADSGASTALTWTTSSAAIAQVSTTGLVTAVAVGIATITATSVLNPSAKGTTVITVSAPTVHGITLSPTNATMYAGGTRTLTATVDADPGVNAALTWTSSTPSVASVSTGGVVTALALGTTTITARSQLVSTITATATITVSVPLPLTQWTESLTTSWETILPGSPSFVYAMVNGDVFTTNYNPWALDSLIFVRRSGQWLTPVQLSFGRPTVIGGSGNDAWVGTDEGKIGQWNGSSFTQIAIPAGLGYVQFIVGMGPGQVVVGGRGPGGTGTVVLILQNGTWTKLPDPGIGDLGGLWGSSLTTFVVVSYFTPNVSPGVKRWNGSAWVAAPDVPNYLYGPAILDNGEGYSAVGWSINNPPTTLRFAHTVNGVTTIEAGPPLAPESPGEYVGSVVRCGNGVYAATDSGGRVLRLQGSTWEVMATFGEALPGARNAAASCGADHVLRVHGDGVMSRWTGSSWVVESFSPFYGGPGRVLSPSDAYLAAGYGGIIHWNGTAWSLEPAHFSSGGWRSFDATADGTLFGILAESPARLWVRQGGAWSSTVPALAQRRVWAASSAFALTATDGSIWYRWDGNSWTSVPGFTNMSALTGLDGSGPNFALAVGARAQFTQSFIARWDGTSWTQMTVPAVGTISSVSVVSPTLAFASSEQSMLRWDGSSWTTFAYPAAIQDWLALNDLSLAAVSATEVYLTYGGDQIWLYNGTGWQQVGQATSPRVGFNFEMIKAVPGFAVAAGDQGIMMIGTPPGGLSAASARFRRDRPDPKRP